VPVSQQDERLPEDPDFLTSLNGLDPSTRLQVLHQLLAEYDRAPPGVFPFPREIITEYIMRGTASANEISPIKLVQSPNASMTQQMQP
jgi:preprotein translocase subunit SecB